MKTNSYYQEFDIRDTAVERLSQKIAQNKRIGGKSDFKRKCEIVFFIICMAMFLTPQLVWQFTGGPERVMNDLKTPVVEAVQTAPEAPKTAPIQIQAVETPKTVVPTKIGASNEQNEMIAYAWEISKDKNFIYTIESESGWVLDKVSGYNSNGTRDWGLGQISAYWHPEIVNDPRFQNNDWRWELSTVYKLYKGGTKFWGAERLKKDKNFYNAVAKNFIWS